jgi:hypothetical protein
MSSNPNDCHVLEERISGHTLYISTTQEQMNKLDPNDPDVQNKRDALTRKLNALHEQLDILHQTLEECQQGKAVNFPDFERVFDEM